MHKIRLVKNDKNVEEFKEKCPNPECKTNTLWVYPEEFHLPVCSDCKASLEGKWLFKLQTDRKNYHLEA